MDQNPKKPQKEYSKSFTTIIASVVAIIAIPFLIFVCYEMHIQQDLTPVASIWQTIGWVVIAIVGFYMWRAKAKSKTDLEWEQTKRLTLFREQHPEYFIKGSVDVSDDIQLDEGEM